MYRVTWSLLGIIINLILLSYLPPPTLGYGLFIQLKDK